MSRAQTPPCSAQLYSVSTDVFQPVYPPHSFSFLTSISSFLSFFLHCFSLFLCRALLRELFKISLTWKNTGKIIFKGSEMTKSWDLEHLIRLWLTEAFRCYVCYHNWIHTLTLQQCIIIPKCSFHLVIRTSLWSHSRNPLASVLHSDITKAGLTVPSVGLSSTILSLLLPVKNSLWPLQ